MLASASAARQRLLEQFGIPYKVMVSGFNEKDIRHSQPKELVQLLAQAKAENVLEKVQIASSKDIRGFKEINFILGCDSVFEFEGEIFEKPLNPIQAIKRLNLMSGRIGILHTGHALFVRNEFLKGQIQNHPETFLVGVVSTRITFGQINQKEIEDYVSTGEPLNCAGGFSLEGKGAKFIKSIDGCYSNVIGLSLPWLREAMAKLY